MELNRDCNSCVHHIQAGGINKTDPSCWSCLSSWTRTGVDLPGWHHKPEEEKKVDPAVQARLKEEAIREALRGKPQMFITLDDRHVPYSPQSKSSSLLEATLNTATGFLLSYLVWILIATPLFNIPVNYTESFWITVLFTGVSLVRSFVWRRVFVNNFWRD